MPLTGFIIAYVLGYESYAARCDDASVFSVDALLSTSKDGGSFEMWRALMWSALGTIHR